MLQSDFRHSGSCYHFFFLLWAQLDDVSQLPLKVGEAMQLGVADGM